MRFEVDPGRAGDIGRQTQAVALEAIEATATAYTDDAGIDVAERLRTELGERGLSVTDPAAIEGLARRIRSGHHVTLD